MSKEPYERAIFLQFAKLNGLIVDEATLRAGNADLQEPDVICDVAGLGAVGFELRRIAESHFMEAGAQPIKFASMLRKQFAALPANRFSELSQKYADADIGVAFAFEHGGGAIQQALPRVFELLESLPAGFSGQHDVDRFGREQTLKWVTIARSPVLKRPVFYVVPDGTWMSDATVDAIKAKIRKTYSALPTRRELLVYFDEQPPMLDEVRLPATDAYLASLQSLGPFVRLWIVNFWSGTIDREFSPTPASIAR